MVLLKGNKWQANATVAGSRSRPSFDTREEAEDYERRAKLGILDRPATLKSFVEEYGERIWKGNRSRYASDQLNVLFAQFGENFPLASFTTEFMEEVCDDWDDLYAPSTINGRISTLSKILKHAQKKGVITDLPLWDRRSLDNLHNRFWKPEEEERAYRFWENNDMLLCRYVCQFLLYTGARKGEAYHLRREDVDLREGFITFRKETTKTNKERIVPLTTKARDSWVHLSRISNHERPLHVLNKATLRRHWDKMRESVGERSNREYVIHMLRHTAASRMVQGGISTFEVGKWLGHAKEQTTLRYAHLAPEHLRNAARILEAA